MKRFVTLLVTLMMLLGMTAALAESRDNEDAVRLDLDIAFERNEYYSMYNVKMSIDNRDIATINHGEPFRGSLKVAPGRHTIVFQNEWNEKITGTVMVTVNEPTRFECIIHAEKDQVRINGKRTTAISVNDPCPGMEFVKYVNGDEYLYLNIDFKRNMWLSDYDAEVWLDGVYVTSIPHGNEYEGFLMVSEGSHVLCFYKIGEESTDWAKYGETVIAVYDKTAYYCTIEATKKDIKVTGEQTFNIR